MFNVKNRIQYLLLTLTIVLLGLGSRKFAGVLPAFIGEFAGDTLWAMMVYFGIRFLFPLGNFWKVSSAALFFSYGIEISQLYQTDWINEVRNTTLGALVLGHGFLWSDLVCYTTGILLATASDLLILSKRKKV